MRQMIIVVKLRQRLLRVGLVSVTFLETECTENRANKGPQQKKKI